MSNEILQDGIHALAPREKMTAATRKLRDTYAITPGAPFYQSEFGFYCEERWKSEGLPEDVSRKELFGYDPGASTGLGGLGWCEAAFVPAFEDKIVEDRGDYEVVQDFAGRKLLVFKGRRSGFMPEYLDHPVKDMRTWEEDVKWRLNPSSPERFAELPKQMEKVKAAAAQGFRVVQGLIGGYMYLRSLIGPTELLFAFHDQPKLIHECMQTWYELAEAVIARYQQEITLDEVFFAEDICYNKASLISHDMIREFLFPYYQQLLNNTRARQIDKQRHMFFQIDTDGYANDVIDLYRGIGMDAMSPFEVASGCDVVSIGRQYPDLVMSGGVDKRVLAAGKEAIDEFLERVFPPMRARGGYIPTCDHGVPEEVSYENYLYYRKRALELGTK
jgi:uroporphyrinogen decarboxylase